MLAISALWWALALATRHAGVALPWAVPPPLAHGLFMAMGFMPLFIVGFLFTAGPRWLGLSDVPARSLRDPVVAMLSGWVLALAGFHLHAVLAGAGRGAGGRRLERHRAALPAAAAHEPGGRPAARPRHHRGRGGGRAGAVGRRGVAGRGPRHGHARGHAAGAVGLPGADLRHRVAPHDPVLHGQRTARARRLAAELAAVGDAGRAGLQRRGRGGGTAVVAAARRLALGAGGRRGTGGGADAVAGGALGPGAEPEDPAAGHAARRFRLAGAGAGAGGAVARADGRRRRGAGPGTPARARAWATWARR